MTKFSIPTGSAAWNRVFNAAGFSDNVSRTAPVAVSATLDTSKVAAAQTGAITYYVRFNENIGLNSASTLYKLSDFSFSDTQALSTGPAATGTGAGKITFNPLTLTFNQGELATYVMPKLDSGAAYGEVDVIGYYANGALAVEDSFGIVAASDLSIDPNGKSLQLQYGAEEIQTYTTSPGGASVPAGLAAWNQVRNVQGFSTTGSNSVTPVAASSTLAAATIATPTAHVSYYVRFSGSAAAFDGATLYELSDFSLEDQRTFAAGNGGSVTPSKATAVPLALSLTQGALTSALTGALTSGAVTATPV